MNIRKVSDISSLIARLLDDARLQDIWVEGEVRDVRCAPKGHRYFSLSEQKNGATYSINCAMWRSYAQELSFDPRDGMRVLVWGSVEVYEPHGKYQLIVRDMHQAGAGEKHLLVQRWKNELGREGLFDELRKRPLPRFPARIGVVTSATGAARRDIENVISRRFPVEIILSPTAVQGDGAHREISAAIRAVQHMVDVVIVGRGGGSFEDLFAFNHPEVVRAIAACPSPVVSAVGHETDITLADFAADVRAPTPSAAAELVVPDRRELQGELMRLGHVMERALEKRTVRSKEVLEDMRLRLQPRRMRRRIDDAMQRLIDSEERLVKGFHAHIERNRLKLDTISTRLEGTNPYAPLTRGYCFVEKDDQVVTSIQMLDYGDVVSLRMKDGRGTACIKELYHDKDI